MLSLQDLVTARFAVHVAVGRYRHGLSTAIDGLGLTSFYSAVTRDVSCTHAKMGNQASDGLKGVCSNQF